MAPDYLSLWPVDWFKCDWEDRKVGHTPIQLTKMALGRESRPGARIISMFGPPAPRRSRYIRCSSIPEAPVRNGVESRLRTSFVPLARAENSAQLPHAGRRPANDHRRRAQS